MAIDSYTDVNTNQTNSAGKLGRNYTNNYIESEVCGGWRDMDDANSALFSDWTGALY